jgi:hypothetical protein
MNYDDALFLMAPYYQKLADMQSAQEIRAFLASEGIRGVCGSTTQCPIAEYVGRRSGVPTCVGGWVIPVSGTGGTPRPAMTPAMLNFIREFDRGIYEELVA